MPSQEIGPLRNGSEFLLVQTVQESCGSLPSAHQLVSLSKCNNLLILPGWGTSWQCSFPLPCCLHSSPSHCPQAALPAAKLLLITILLLHKALAGITLALNSLEMNHEELVPKHFRINTAWRTAYGSHSRCLFPDVMWESLSSSVQDKDGFQPCVVCMWSWFPLSDPLLIMQTLPETCT